MSLVPIKEKYNEIKDFFLVYLIPTYLPGVNSFLVGQSAPRPENPYVSVHPMVQIDTVGIDEVEIDENGEELLVGRRTVVCDLYGYSDAETRFDGNTTAWEMLQELRFALGYPDTRIQLSQINCSVQDEGTVLDTSENLNTTNEPTGIWQVTFNTTICQSVDRGAIETVNGSGVYEGPEKDLDVTFSVSKP
jgi:hypothetical protein